MNSKILSCVLVLCLTCASCDPTPEPIVYTPQSPNGNSVVGCTDPFSFNYNPLATQGDSSCRSMGNCSGFTPGGSNSGSIGTTLYNSYYDQKLIQEIAIQGNFYGGIPASVYILYEPSVDYKNAYARSDGAILFGYYMFFYTIQMYGELPIAGILAHEWGHRVQQTLNLQGYYRPEHRELEADAFSGYYMALRKQWSWGQIQSYYANVYATGNYLYNAPDFHGTPDQRLAAAHLGVTTGLYALQNGVQYSYSDLHAIFFNTIATNIAPRHQNVPVNYEEIVYPTNLTEAYLQRLFPKK